MYSAGKSVLVVTSSCERVSRYILLAGAAALVPGKYWLAMAKRLGFAVILPGSPGQPPPIPPPVVLPLPPGRSPVVPRGS